MAKIVQVLNSMISNERKISNVLKGESMDSFFFMYDGKYKWSISKSQDYQSNDLYYVCFYPSTDYSMEDLTRLADLYGINYVVYSTADIKTIEAYETFQELYQIVSEKLYGLDEIFDKIINDK